MFLSYISFLFILIFLPITFLLCFAFQKKYKVVNAILCIASLIFYSTYGYKYVLYLLASIAITYVAGLLCEKLRENKPKTAKVIVASSIIINLLMLCFFKYTNFAADSINSLLNINIQLPGILLPVGMSFYIFQSTSYLIDVLRKDVKTEKNIISYALFVSFFPSIVSGPIQKSKEMLPKINSERIIKWESAQIAFVTFLYGAFMKIVLADRLAVFTNEVFGNYENYEGFYLIAAACAYSVQIYADFAGYSYMAIGVSKLLGFDLADNFRQPYLATTIHDFWGRWHISLTSWFRTYLYIPLGGNRKGTFRKYLNVFIVFLVSGLWHGAAWTFIIWGAIHAIYQIVGNLTLPTRVKACEKLKISRERTAFKMWQRFGVFVLTTFAWIFFRAPDLTSAIGFIKGMFVWNPWVLFKENLNKVGFADPIELRLCLIFIAIVIVVSCLRERNRNAKTIISQWLPVRWAVYIILLFSLLIFGMYGPDYSSSAFIYAGF